MKGRLFTQDSICTKSIFILGMLALSTIIVACGLTPVEPTAVPTIAPTLEATGAPSSTPSEEIPQDIRAARDSALQYVRRTYEGQAPATELEWAGERTTGEGLLGLSSFRYKAGDWVMDIDAPVVAPENAIYQVTLLNASTGFQWQGQVDAAGEVSEPPVTDDGRSVAGWYGRVIGTPEGAQYDDHLMLLPKGTGDVGIEGADQAIQAEIEALRDSDLPAHFWGTLLRDVPDYGGYQLRVDRIRPDEPGASVESAVVGWEGIVIGTPEDAQFDDHLQLTGKFPVRYGIESTDAQIAGQLELVRDTLTPVHVWGTLTCGVPDVNGCQLHVTRLLLVGEPLAPTPTPEPESSEDEGEPVEGWVGTIVDLPPGNQFGQYFEREDGDEFGIGTLTDAVREQVNEARSSGARIMVWGTLYTGVPAVEARTIEVERIEFLSQPEEEGQPVAGWTGTIHKLPPGNQFGQFFVRDDGERYGIGVTDDPVRQQINEAAWIGAQIRVWGRLYTGVPATEARQLEVDCIEIVSRAAGEARDLSSFAEVSASSHLPSDRYGSYFPYAAIDGLQETAWVEGVSGPGVGEWIQLTFPGTIDLRVLRFDVGFDESAGLFAKNNRIKRVTLLFSTGEQTTIDFNDARGLQEFAMVRAPGPNVETTYVRMIIDEVYPGTRYDDTCLAEVEVWGVAK